MGNTAAYDQLPSALRQLNEDNMVVILRYLDIPDFVHLIETCRQFLGETLGPNNYLWAQLLDRPVTHIFFPPPRCLANLVLQTTRNGRKFVVDGAPLDLSAAFDTRNRHLISHFDFKKEIKAYCMQKCVENLRKQLRVITYHTNAGRFRTISAVENINLSNYDLKTDIKNDGAVTDVTFVVELGVDSTSLEELENRKLPGMHRHRRVVYAKADMKAYHIDLFSRGVMMNPEPYRHIPVPSYGDVPLPATGSTVPSYPPPPGTGNVLHFSSYPPPPGTGNAPHPSSYKLPPKMPPKGIPVLAAPQEFPKRI